MSYLAEEADVIVVGGGHAGCEAALAAPEGTENHNIRHKH